MSAVDLLGEFVVVFHLSAKGTIARRGQEKKNRPREEWSHRDEGVEREG